MTAPNFHPEHINATHNDFKGNDGLGRYVFFPGSDGRAKKIAELFTLAAIYEHEQRILGVPLKNCQIKAGTVCVVLGEGSDFGTTEALAKITNEVSEIAVNSVLELAKKELG